MEKIKDIPHTLKNTLGKPRRTGRVYEPNSIAELKEIHKELVENSIPFSVSSTGNNWGYGCNSPVHDNMAVIGLKKLNRIVDFDPFHGLITVEPGVTYGQMAEYLGEGGVGGVWMTPVHGGGPDCSAMGNALERGYGLTPKTDHWGAVTSIKAILKDGALYEGSLAKLGQDRLEKLFKYGVGAYLDGAFSQSDFGIVTEMTIKLARKPSYIEMFYFRLMNEEDLDAAILATKNMKIKLGDTLGGVNFINKERALSMVIDYPMDKIKNGMPLSVDEINFFGKQNMLTPWLIVGAMYGEKPIVKQAKKLLLKEFKKIKTKKLFYNSSNRKVLLTAAKFFPKIGSFQFKTSIEKLDNAFEILNGKPNNLALNLAYWKNEKKKEYQESDKRLNPTQDNCGLLWYAPLVEFKPECVESYIKFIRMASERFNTNPIITLTTVDDLCFDSTIPIIFNKDNKKDKDRAWAYYNFLLEEGAKRGFFPYRLNIESQKKYDLNPYKVSVESKTENSQTDCNQKEVC